MILKYGHSATTCFAIAAVVLFVFALVLRCTGLDSYPWPHATDDEYHYLWAGMSLWEGEPPKSWSFLKVPKDAVLGLYTMSGQNYPIVQPAFDHPPLYSILAGATGKLFAADPSTVELIIPGEPPGHTILWDPNFGLLRLLPIVLFAITFWVLWLLGKITLGNIGALGALVIFTCIEIFNVHQRLAVSDSLLALIVPSVILSLELWKRERMGTVMTGTVVIAGIALAAFTKIIGLSLVPAVIAWGWGSVFQSSKLRYIWAWALAGGVGGIALVFGFAAYWDFDVFWQTTMAQADRFKHLNGVIGLVREQWIFTEKHSDLWLISSWILCFMALADAGAQVRGVFCALIGYVLAYGFFAVDNSYGWHLLPFFSFLALAWGWGIKQVWTSPATPTALVVIVLLLCCAGTTWLADYPGTRVWGRYIYAAIALLILLPLAPKRERAAMYLFRSIMIILLSIGMAGQIESHLRHQAAYTKGYTSAPIR